MLSKFLLYKTEGKIIRYSVAVLQTSCLIGDTCLLLFIFMTEAEVKSKGDLYGSKSTAY